VLLQVRVVSVGGAQGAHTRPVAVCCGGGSGGGCGGRRILLLLLLGRRLQVLLVQVRLVEVRLRQRLGLRQG